MKDREKGRTKAIILCGGEGKRLRPLTACMPKPMLTINNNMVLKNILRLLSRHGIKDVAITLGYRGNMIKEALGNHFLDIELTYYEENEPLGSAGGVKKAENFFTGEDFMVICGDAWCDFDLSAAYDYFKVNNCDGLILTDLKPESPLEYGLVISNGSKAGKISAFVEKPSWSGVCSPRVNTGMYIFKKDILELIPQGKSDFGFDLFTKLPESGKNIHCYDIDGYWQDIGTLRDYYNCNIKEACYENSIGADCQIDATSSLKSSVILDCVTIGAMCHIEEAVIGTGCIVGNQVKIESGAVIGPFCVIGDRAIVGKGVSVPEGRVIKSGEVLQNPLYNKDLFTDKGIKLHNNESDLYSLGIVIGDIYSKKRVGVIYGQSISEGTSARILMLGLSCAQCFVLDLGKGFESLASYASRLEHLDLAIFLRRDSDGLILRFFDKYGAYPGASFESLVTHKNTCMSSFDVPKYRPIKIQGGLIENYIKALASQIDYSLSGIGFTFYTEGLFGNALSACIKSLGGKEVESQGNFIISNKSTSSAVDIIYDGVFYDFDHVRGICIIAYSKMGIKEISLPYRTNDALKELVKKCGMRLCLYSETPYDKRENARLGNIFETPALYDGGFALVTFINFALKTRLGPTELMDLLPEFSTKTKKLFVPKEKKQLIAFSGDNYDKEGFVLRRNGGNVRIIPENGDNMCLCAEAATMENANDLIKFAEEYINNFKNQV